jgi:hypothetical protein
MKNCKQCTFFAFLAILVLAFTFIACDNGNGNNNVPECTCPDGTVHTDAPCACGGKNCGCTYQPVVEIPELRTETIYINFDDNPYDPDNKIGVHSVTVEGELFASEWIGLAQRFQTALQVNYDAQTLGAYKIRYMNVFEFDSGKIIIKKTSEFDKWFVSNRYLIYFNYDYVQSLSDTELASNDVMRSVIGEMNNAPLP